MQASPAVVSENQLACAPMSETEARPPEGAAVTPPSGVLGGGGLPPFYAQRGPPRRPDRRAREGSSDPLLLTLLASLATILGVFSSWAQPPATSVFQSA